MMGVLMDKREKIAKAALHTVDFGSGGWSGGRPEFTSQDVAAAMGMGHLSTLQTAMLLIKYCGMQDYGLWHAIVLDIARIWPSWIGEHDLPIMGQAAMRAWLTDSRCGICQGTMWEWLAVPPIPCPDCGGTGYAQLDWHGKAPWPDRFRGLLYYLESQETAAIRALEL